MKAMATVQDLIEEAKLRTVWWALCVFVISYFLTHTSKSMWMNLPIAVLLVSALRILFNEIEFRRKVRPIQQQTYLSHLEKKQLSVNDSRLSSALPPPRWKRKIHSPIVEAAMKDFIDKLLKDFVVDLWYSEITPDKEFPDQIHALIMDALGEIAVRVKDINLVDLLTRDVVDLVGDHLDLFRRNQAAIGVDVMGTLSSEERDERLKHHLMASKELHPALVSPESEYKVLQRLMSGVLTSVLRPRETQCPVVRSIARELLTCLVVQPLMNFASPGYINELIECIVLATKAESDKDSSDHYKDSSTAVLIHVEDLNKRKCSSLNPGNDSELAKIDSQQERTSDYMFQEEPLQLKHADWARVLNAATQRRTEVLMPENLENMWTKGRNYKKKENKIIKVGDFEPMPTTKDSGISSMQPAKVTRDEMLSDKHRASIGPEEKVIVRKTSERHFDVPLTSEPGDKNKVSFQLSQDLPKDSSTDGKLSINELKNVGTLTASATKKQLKRSNSTSALTIAVGAGKTSTVEGGRSIISDFYGPNFGKHSEEHLAKSASDMVVQKEGLLVPKLRSRVMGAYFEKIGSKSFAVYSIAVTDANNKTWFVKRRYRNFERLHRHLKDIPNYTLHLPPKRIFSSSTEDAFVHQRCIQLDKYLQELLSIANVAEQHEVWDFLSVSSKNYSFGKSPSVMRTLAVNVDDAVDDIVRQFKGVSDGFMRKVVGSTSPSDEACASSNYDRKLSFNSNELRKHVSAQYNLEEANNMSDEEGERLGSENHEKVSGWHSDTELNSKSFPPRVIKRGEESDNLVVDKKNDLELRSGASHGGFSQTSYHMDDPEGMPPEWTPPNVSVPLLNLVDKIFQLNRRGWIRRQVLWISKQILQLIMEDAIDDWIVRQIHWLRREDIIAQGIRWVQDVLWPNGTFFIQLRNAQSEDDDTQSTTSRTDESKIPKPGSFELQLEAARRASDVKKMLFGGAPTPLVSLIGNNQYKRCAKDIYYFTQSSVCVKQLGYGLLELILVSVFPELRNLVLEIHDKLPISPIS
ncbi:uncharacterized protein LOC111007705 isoform X2 [Momordica charantia]|uniref:Uncharacterized protein LOC111007705 isoform X2 n=1 Tax=Momordica charantia TaxID=3673 RepID=A0A6J1C622_MOMCH|nr:uncharacterized protein LOC111007705 isoform X2 [Momordica charantia]